MSEDVHPLCAYRLKQNPPLTQEALAAAVRTSKATISRIEARSQTPGRELLKELTGFTGLSADQIFGLTEERAA